MRLVMSCLIAFIWDPSVERTVCKQLLKKKNLSIWLVFHLSFAFNQFRWQTACECFLWSTHLMALVLCHSDLSRPQHYFLVAIAMLLFLLMLLLVMKCLCWPFLDFVVLYQQLQLLFAMLWSVPLVSRDLMCN